MNPLHQPLLSPTEINQLIKQAGSAANRLPPEASRRAQSGEQPSTITGSGMDFADRRPYVSGDDPRFIDWRASARSGLTLIRRYNTELSTPACIVIDRRASMCFGTRKRLKVTQAVRAGITLGTQLLQAGNRLACLLLDQPGYWQPAQSSLAALRHTAQLAARACPPAEDSELDSSWNRIGDRLNTRLAQGSRLILISDFVTLDPSSQQALRRMGRYYDLSAVQIIDPAERELPAIQNISLHWGQKSLRMHNDPGLRQRFKRDLTQRLQQQAEWFKQANCPLLRLSCADELESLRELQ